MKVNNRVREGEREQGEEGRGGRGREVEKQEIEDKSTEVKKLKWEGEDREREENVMLFSHLLFVLLVTHHNIYSTSVTMTNLTIKYRPTCTSPAYLSQDQNDMRYVV